MSLRLVAPWLESAVMLTYWLWIIASLVLLYFGAEGLVRGSASLALRLGLTPLVVGLTVVAMGTSMPEVMVSVRPPCKGAEISPLGMWWDQISST